MIDILTGTAFDAPKRLNHREDEVSLEFPSSVSSRVRHLNALKAQNWRASGSPTPPEPYDAEVEWLEKTALGPYIDTGVVTKAGTDSFALEINMTYDRVHNLRRLHGADNGRFVGCSANSSLWDMGNVSFAYGDFHRVRSDVSATGGWAFSVDGASPYRTGTTTATSEFSTYIFSIATNDSTVARYESVYCRVKDAKVWKNGALVRDFIPVRVGQVGMMYDRVSGALFGNSGTGAFVVGPDI